MSVNATRNVLLFLYTETSLHAGTGSTISAVDLPIQRERTTHYPIVQGSGIKGALRSQCTSETQNAEIDLIFGKATEGKEDTSFAGAVSFSEARIILFPVRSLAGVFAYITCPLILARLAREALQANIAGEPLPTTLSPTEGQALISSKKKSGVLVDGAVILEEFTFTAQPDPQVDTIAEWLCTNALPAKGYTFWQTKLKESLVIISDTDFRDFVVNSTEVTTHIKLKPGDKTVDGGALWTQESLPSDTLLFTTAVARRPRGTSTAALATPENVLAWLVAHVGMGGRVQLGGDETTGQGIVALSWTPKQ